MPCFKTVLLSFLISFPLLSQNPERFMVMLATEGTLNAARAAHTFATFITLEKEKAIEEFTISWLPQEGFFGPDYTMPVLGIVPGRNYSLDETLDFYRLSNKWYWGPYKISETLYQSALNRLRYLESGKVRYKMIPRDDLRKPALTNQPGGVINCIIAVSDIGGFLKTGVNWGSEASVMVLHSFRPHIDQYPEKVYPGVAKAMRLEERLTSGGR